MTTRTISKRAIALLRAIACRHNWQPIWTADPVGRRGEWVRCEKCNTNKFIPEAQP
jgi:hypothetical protein